MDTNRLSRLIAMAVLGVTLAACSAAPIGTPAPTVNIAPTAPPATVAPTIAVVPATSAPTEAAATPTLVVPTTAPVDAALVPPMPDCSTALALTPSQTEGPYYKADTPDRTDLTTANSAGTKLIVTGYVLTTDCKPVAGAWLDFWQADDEGAYDNAGYNFRGHQTTDATGRYQLETVIPGLYPGRTRHIHVKVQAPNGPILTTQLYFPDEAANARDGIFDPALIVNLQTTSAGDVATFNFVINTK